MRLTSNQIRNGLIATLIAATQLAGAATFDWTGAGGVSLPWSTPANWLPIGSPGAGDDVRFFDLGAVFDTTTINNTVSANLVVRSVWFGQSNGVHNLFINPGRTLTVRGTNDNGNGPLGSAPAATDPNPNVQSTFYVGTKVEVEAGTIVNATISGEGTLVLDNPNNELNVRQVFGGGGGAHTAILDMSGLNSFVASLGRIRIGDGEAGRLRRAQGTVRLAKTNLITLSGPSQADNVQLVIGNNDVNNNGNGGTSFLYLGERNTLNVDEILVGARKTPGAIAFNDNLISPTLLLRGSDGTSRVRALRIGDESDQANSGNPTTGRMDLNLGTVDIKADKIIVGKSQQQGGQGATGQLTIGAGTVDVNTLEIAYQTDDRAANPVNGTVTFDGAAVVVNNLLRLGRSAGALPARNATLNIGGGSVTVRSNLVTEGTATISITKGLLALEGRSALSVSVLTLDGGSISNASTLKATNSLTVTNSGKIIGNPVFDLGNSGTATWDVQGAPGSGLTVSNALQGSGTYLGNLIQAPGGILRPGGSGAAGTLSISGGTLTMNGGVLQFDLSNNGSAGNDQITVAGSVAVNAATDVNLSALNGAFDTAKPYTLLTATQLTGDQGQFKLAGALAQSRYNFTFDTTSTPNSLKLSVGGTGPASLTWVGGASANTWDLKGAANWTSGAGNQFFSLDNVIFNDSGPASSPVTLTGALTPGSITVNNPANNYVFSGTGSLLGAPLTKSGSGSLTFNNTGDNSFGGAVRIQSGAVMFSNSGLNTFANGLAINGGSATFGGSSKNDLLIPVDGTPVLTIGAGSSLTVSNSNPNNFNGGTIQLNGTLAIDQGVDSTLDATIVGGGTLTKAGTGTLALAADNSGLTTSVQINGGTLKAVAPNALGLVGVTIASGGQLNANGQNFTVVPITVSGAGPDGSGAVVNTGVPQPNSLGSVTLTGHTTVGGSGPWNTDPVLNFGRMDIRGGTLSTGNQPLNLTKVGGNQVTLATATVDAALADIEVQQGLLAFEGDTGSMGNPTRTLTVRAGATVSFFDTTTAWDKKFVLFGNGATPNLFNYNGVNMIIGAVTLNGDCVISAAPADRGAPVSLTLSGPIGGTGSLIKPSVDTLILSGTNTYTGETFMNNGTLALAGTGTITGSSTITVKEGATLDASTRTDGTLTLASNQTLKGNGAITGNLIANPGSTLAPGLPVGTLAINGNAILQGTTTLELDAARDTNDLLVAASVNYGGTLALANVAGNLASGDSFKLFQAATYRGTFASIAPATPGSGLTWDTSTLATDGTLRIKAGGTISPTIGKVSFSAGNLLFSGSGGPIGGSYSILTSTNIALRASSWTTLLTNVFDSSGNFSLTNSVDLNARQRFYLIQTP